VVRTGIGQGKKAESRSIKRKRKQGKRQDKTKNPAQKSGEIQLRRSVRTVEHRTALNRAAPTQWNQGRLSKNGKPGKKKSYQRKRKEGLNQHNKQNRANGQPSKDPLFRTESPGSNGKLKRRRTFDSRRRIIRTLLGKNQKRKQPKMRPKMGSPQPEGKKEQT